MKTAVETISSVRRKLQIDVPVDMVNSAFVKAAEKVQKNAKLKGFRKGKVPMTMVEKHYGDEIYKQAFEDLLDESYPKAVEEAALIPLSRPEVDVKEFEKGKTLSYSATFEVRPEVAVSGYKGLSLTQPSTTVTDAEVDERLKSLQEQLTQLEPVTDPAATLASGMVAVVDFDGAVDGVRFKGSQAKDFSVDLGSGQLLPEFETALTGLKVGDTKTVAIPYPADYFNAELAGKTGEYSVTVKEIKTKKMPELNDEFAKDCGEFATLADLRARIKGDMADYKTRAAREAVMGKAVETLIQAHTFDVPDTMTNWELSMMVQQYQQSLKQRGQKEEDVDLPKFVEQYRSVAVDRVKGYLILDAIAKVESIEVTPDEVSTRLESMAASAKRPIDEVRSLFDREPQRAADLRYQMMHEKVLDFVIQNAKITEEPLKK